MLVIYRYIPLIMNTLLFKDLLDILIVNILNQ